MKFSKIREVKSPCRAHDTDAGIDFFIPEDFPTTTLKVGESILIPSGVKAEIPKGYMLTAFNKSGVASKKGLLVGAAVCDTNYSGEIHINLHKVSGEPIELNPGDKIVQFILMPISLDVSLEEVQECELYNGESTERGAGGFGSTGV